MLEGTDHRCHATGLGPSDPLLSCPLGSESRSSFWVNYQIDGCSGSLEVTSEFNYCQMKREHGLTTAATTPLTPLRIRVKASNLSIEVQKE